MADVNRLPVRVHSFLMMNACGKNISEKYTGICYDWNREACPGFTKSLEFTVLQIICGGNTWSFITIVRH